MIVPMYLRAVEHYYLYLLGLLGRRSQMTAVGFRCRPVRELNERHDMSEWFVTCLEHQRARVPSWEEEEKGYDLDRRLDLEQQAKV